MDTKKATQSLVYTKVDFMTERNGLLRRIEELNRELDCTREMLKEQKIRAKNNGWHYDDWEFQDFILENDGFYIVACCPRDNGPDRDINFSCSFCHKTFKNGLYYAKENKVLICGICDCHKTHLFPKFVEAKKKEEMEAFCENKKKESKEPEQEKKKKWFSF